MARPGGEIAGGGVKIINASLFRMGTKSMAEAFQILGIQTFHALDSPMRVNWVLLEKAAEATWPSVPNARPRPPFERADWDELWGSEYDAVCDTAAPFTLELLKAYPDAKVVLVQRDFESWWPSFQSEISGKLFGPLVEFQLLIAWHLLGYRAGHAMKKLLLGFFDARDATEIEANARETYENHFRSIRGALPRERLLEYKLGSGWEPLCEFLGKEVPDVPFPHANDRKAHSDDLRSRKRRLYIAMAKHAAFWGLGAVTVWVAWRLFPRS